MLEIFALGTERAAFLILRVGDFTNHRRLALCLNLSTQSQFTVVWDFFGVLLGFFFLVWAFKLKVQ